MKNLNRVLSKLKQLEKVFTGTYFIPEAWNTVGYERFTRDAGRAGEIEINPYDFYAFCIEVGILSEAMPNTDALVPLGISKGKTAADLKKSVIYSMFPRAFTAWNHGDAGQLQGGTFLKAICILPYLKKLGVDILYLLPIFEYSSRYRKGEIGSPYAIKNIYRLDPILHETLLGDYSEEVLETEFKAFVEACHILGIKVMVDYVFRTVSRDNDLIASHPEWFYWIGLEHKDTFSAPTVAKAKQLTALSDKIVDCLYKDEDSSRYLCQFTPPPSEMDAVRWKELVGRQKNSGENMLDLIEAEFGITTAPGFSDMINDPQPPWTDATYLRFYFDTHSKARQYVNSQQPPYIMQDGIKLNLYPGEKLNRELWDYVAGVIPYYQERFGIDGARIDMGHALPNELNREIIARVKSKNEHFVLWSEEFHVERSKAAREDGFHFISGFIWSIYKDLEKPGFNKKLVFDTLMKAEIPVTAALETPDTPRAALVHKDRRRLEQVLLINCFIPNAIPFINNGLEVMEVQPMNLGLDNTEEGRFVLDQEDPMYGKLAFFDHYRIHWTTGNCRWMQQLLLKAFSLRSRFAGIMSVKENFLHEQTLVKSKKLIQLCYFDRKKGKGVFLLANRSFNSRARVRYEAVIPEGFTGQRSGVHILHLEEGLQGEEWKPGKGRLLQPGEVIIASIG